MSELPSSSWLEAIEKVALWLLLALVGGLGTTVLLFYFDSSILRETPGSTKSIIVIGFIISVFFVLARLSKIIFDVYERNKTEKGPPLKKRFAELSDQQRVFLIDKYRRSSRQFEAHNAYVRWLEELENWNYVKWSSPMIIVSNQPHTYFVTERAWLEMDKLNAKGKLS